MAQVSNPKDADSTSPDEDTTVTNVGDGPERVVGPSGKDLEPKSPRVAPGRQERRELKSEGG